MFKDISLIGGHPALDFFNSVKYRGAKDPGDRLSSMSDVLDWCQIARLLSESERDKMSRQSHLAAPIHKKICTFREQGRVLFNTGDIGTPQHIRAMALVTSEIEGLRPIVTINPNTGQLSRKIIIEDIKGVKSRIVDAVAELLSTRMGLRIKTCNGIDCDWLFIDKTKAHRRQWCDSRTCGNTARVRRFRQRS